MISLVLGWLITTVAAAPRELEVWFLTPPKTAALEQWLYPVRMKSPLWAQSCEAIGDFCFDPGIGLYRKNQRELEKDPVFIPEKELPQLPTAHSVDRSLVSCDPNYAFDMFCGEARPESTKAVSALKLEIWFDTSSSLREMDTADAQGNCHRKKFLESLSGECPFQQKVRVKMYDLSLAEMPSMASACQAQGQNNTKRLIEWIEASEVPKLIVITDVNEYHKEMADYISSRNGKVRGDSGSFTAADLVPLAATLAATCR
jgi:hypothetical protein